MKKIKMLFAFLFLAILTTIIAGCGSDSTPTTPATLAVTTASLPGVTVNTVYSQTLAASSGTAPYTWSISVGALPIGLSLNPSTGAITGTPTTVTTASFTVKVTDSATPAGTATKVLSIAVNAPAALAVTTASLPAATIGTIYSQNLGASGGTGPYSWALATGSTALPAWLTLSPAGTLSGTPPTGAVTANFTVMVTDSATPAARTATQPLSITVSSAPAAPAAPTNTAATGGTNSVTISWNAVAGATSYNLYWSTTTGVTTAGTKIALGNVTSTKHSRLTATPTWLAAGTPYFYIVTAVNANGESTPSGQATATTSATDGVALYGINCQGCHNPLATSAKTGRTALQTQNAINNNTGGMGSTSLLSLTPAQVQAIADVLVTGF